MKSLSDTELVFLETKQEWEEMLQELDSFDFYHTYDYHIISKNQNEKPLLLVYKTAGGIIALPLLLRKIEGTDYFDATSVYGYAGPVSKNITEDFDNSMFAQELRRFCLDRKIVAVFSRLNPYIDHQDQILKNIGTLTAIGNLVNLDLTKSAEDQWSDYRRDSRSRVNKARRLCSVKKAETDDEIRTFIEIYTETMEKLDADPSYFFGEDYFFNFLKCDGFETDILLAVLDENKEVIGGSMFVKTNNIIQYHLSGTKTAYMKMAPSRLLLDEMRLIGTEQGYKYFNLGGGYQCREDALYDFKSSFSKDTRSWKIWKYTVNEEKYKELTLKSEVGKTDFFPAYRAKEKI